MGSNQIKTTTTPINVMLGENLAEEVKKLASSAMEAEPGKMTAKPAETITLEIIVVKEAAERLGKKVRPLTLNAFVVVKIIMFLSAPISPRQGRTGRLSSG